VARGTQHRKRRTPAHARVAPAPAKAKPRVKHERWEDQLFFSRLRVHAKWMFVLLALVFALGFVVFGVGSGSTGISDVLQNFFRGTSSSGASASSLRKKAEAHPNNPTAWHNLATKLEANNDFNGAIGALQRYVALRPKDQNVLEELGSVYLRQAQVEQQTYIDAQTRSQILAPAPPGQPPASSKLGKALASLSNPIQSAVSTAASTQTTASYGKLIQLESNAVDTYKKLAKLSPKDAPTQLRLAQVAEGAGDTTTAITAYKTFLKLAPDDPVAPSAKKALKQLEKQLHPTATGKAKHK
jgi:cytochrome c-type biogenesis protein CcmH/NrfG